MVPLIKTRNKKMSSTSFIQKRKNMHHLWPLWKLLRLKALNFLYETFKISDLLFIASINSSICYAL